MSNASIRPHYLSIGAVCSRIGGDRPINKSTVYRKVRTGELPKPLKFGRVARWREEEIDTVLQRLADAREKSGA